MHELKVKLCIKSSYAIGWLLQQNIALSLFSVLLQCKPLRSTEWDKAWLQHNTVLIGMYMYVQLLVYMYVATYVHDKWHSSDTEF